MKFHNKHCELCWFLMPGTIPLNTFNKWRSELDMWVHCVCVCVCIWTCGHGGVCIVVEANFSYSSSTVYLKNNLFFRARVLNWSRTHQTSLAVLLISRNLLPQCSDYKSKPSSPIPPPFLFNMGRLWKLNSGSFNYSTNSLLIQLFLWPLEVPHN